ncbi:hypothetical protein C8D70_1258 [Chryseobacterium sp. CBTAP 102]|uniref:hypothetical protein n=1 Tax=Chryseobacterium sp. CBTAP 102 TaxID=2135644 RepID=UPI000D770966|nr:hypothetical protein [Chryseobacterium sp. CBTAP 102]PXW06476.1 hypothetical protein C8D70_1258 [Chryseobacterium sp. CBTAP 102]
MNNQSEQQNKTVLFEVLEIIDTRKTGSTIEVGKTYLGSLYPNNWVYFTDVNEQEWAFYVGDTCRIIQEVEQTEVY